MLGCWNCVAAVYAGRHYIARVQGQALNVGVFVDRTHVSRPMHADAGTPFLHTA